MKKRKIFLLADVDDSVIDTSRVPTAEGAAPVAWDNQGAIVGYLTPKQKAMLDWYLAGCELVPTTARSTDAVRRMKLPFRRYGITAFGGTILGAGGTPLKSWHKHIQADAERARPVLAELAGGLTKEAAARAIDVRATVLTDFGIDMFLSVKHNRRNLEELAAMADFVRAHVPCDWTVHLNGNFLAAYPPFIGKEKAARWFIDNIVPDDAVTIGLGDSLTDVPFMALCDYAMMPTQSQNFRAFLKLIA